MEVNRVVLLLLQTKLTEISATPSGHYSAKPKLGCKGLSSLLGGDASGLNMFKKMTGFNAAAEEGSRGITGNAAASGLLQSGSTGKALQRYGNEISNQYANNYMDRLLAQAGLGLQAGNVLSGGAGQTSSLLARVKEQGTDGGFLGSSYWFYCSARLKKNIHKVGELDNGLNVYQYRYIKDDEKVHRCYGSRGC